MQLKGLNPIRICAFSSYISVCVKAWYRPSVVSTENQFYSSICTPPSTIKLLKGPFRYLVFWLPLFAWLLTSLLTNGHLSQKMKQLRQLGSSFHLTLLCHTLAPPLPAAWVAKESNFVCQPHETAGSFAWTSAFGSCFLLDFSTFLPTTLTNRKCFSTFLPTTLTNQKCFKNKSRVNATFTLSSPLHPLPPINPEPLSLSW